MEDFYMNITSQDKIYNYSNITSNYYDNSTTTFSNTILDNEYYRKVKFIVNMTTRAIIVIGLPLTLVAIYALYSLLNISSYWMDSHKNDRQSWCQEVRNGHVAPIYVINLLISDIIQLCCMIVEVVPTEDWITKKIFGGIYAYCVMVSVCFMVCIALERYLVIAHPLWYHCRRTIKFCVGVCVLIWVLLLVCVPIFIFWVDPGTISIILGIFFFLPVPLFIFFLGGTLKALSSSRVPSDEKRRIVGTLVLVLLIYMLLFLPTIILLLSQGDLFSFTLSGLSSIFLKLSPLADLTLYIFMRKGAIDKLLSSVCCCRMDRMDSDDTNTSSV